jgi:multiple sugar transport system permease protein
MKTSSKSLSIQKWHEPLVFIGPAVLILLAITIYPLFYSLFMSFHKIFLTKMHLGTPFIGFDNYRRVFTDNLFWISLKNTFVFSFSSVGVEFVLGIILALLVDRIYSAFKDVARTFLLLPMIIAPVVVALIWRFMYNTDFGIINYFLNTFFGIEGKQWLADPNLAMSAVIIMDVWEWTPFMFLIFLAGLQSLPQDPYEAAYIDGASSIQVFFYITIPLLKKIVLLSLLIRLIDAIKTFDNVFVLTRGGPGSSTELLSLYIYRNGFRHFNIGYGSALSIILLIIVVFFSKLLINLLSEKNG